MMPWLAYANSFCCSDSRACMILLSKKIFPLNNWQICSIKKYFSSRLIKCIHFRLVGRAPDRSMLSHTSVGERSLCSSQKVLKVSRLFFPTKYIRCKNNSNDYSNWCHNKTCTQANPFYSIERILCSHKW